MDNLIRRAVELAPHWEAHETAFSFKVRGFGWYSPEPSHYYGRDQWFFDALAAALVREVEKAGEHFSVEPLRNCTTVTDLRFLDSAGYPHVLTEAEGDDRTENTLRACVEFLEGGEG